ncbi:hypothetical protein PM082_019816 [Marasmius tenuissimus]|nr:hypothetical protein PM082_019816 [Marasmius tenuissimus]
MRPTQTRAAYHPKAGGGYKNLAFKDVHLPALKPSEVLVKIHAVSLNSRDLLISAGTYPGALKDGTISCSDMAGEVVAVGNEVTEWKTGDRVCVGFMPEYLHGGVTVKSTKSALGVGEVDGVLTQYKNFKEYVSPNRFRAREDSLVAIPEHLSYEEGATLPCAAVTAYNALSSSVPVKAGDTVLVLGTGGVSIFAIQFAVASGATVIVTSSSDDKLAVAKKLGAHHFINYLKTPEWHTEVLRITNGRGVDHTVEVGGPATLAKSLQATRLSGFVAIIRARDTKESSSVAASVMLSAMLVRQLNLKGLQVGSVDSFKNMNRLIASRPEITRPVIDKVFAFEDSAKAFEHLESQKHIGKVVIKMF